MPNINTPTASIIADLRQILQPKGSAPYVGLKTAGAGIWLPFEFIQGCITQLEQIVVLTSVGEKPPHLVRIAYHLLLDSAYVPPTSEDIIAKLKAALQPQGSAALVGLKTAGAGIWLSVDHVQAAINELEKLPQRTTLGEPPSPLEQVAYMLLCDSAGIAT